MPLVRVEVRNEYGLGAPELYKTANKDDPKALLDGVAVAGLVGILRQLGDLAEFAAEVFHDLQEQVIATAARSHKMMVRVQQMEAALPPLEKAVLAQTNHIHFSYTAGSDWHANIRTEQNHLIHSDLPQFIMDSYEECRDPPRLHLLDKFDTGGPGTCLKKYSDPTFFKRALASSEPVNAEKVQREKKAHKSKKKGSQQRNGEVSHAVSISQRNGRMQFSSPNIYGQSSAAETMSTFDMRSKSELGDQSTSFDSRNRSGYIECVFDVSSSMRHEEQEHNDLSTPRLKLQGSGTLGSFLPNEQNGGADDDLPNGSLQEQSIPNSSYVTWDEKTEIVKPTNQQSGNIVEDRGEASELLPASSDLSRLESEAARLVNVDPEDIMCDDVNIPESLSDENQFDEVGSEPDNYMDALNIMDSEIETDFECQTKREVELPSTNFGKKGMECRTGTMHEMIDQNSDSSDVESHTASYSSSNKQKSKNASNPVFSEDLVLAQPPKIASMSPNRDVSVDTDLCECTDLLDISRVNAFESAINDPSSSGSNISNSEAPLDDKSISSLCESQESPAEISDASSFKFWTNGGLLGLEPSKPPDCSVLNILAQNSTLGTEDDARDPSSDTVIPKSHSDGPVRKLDTLVKTPEPVEKKASFIGGRDRSPDIVSLNDLPSDPLIRRMGNIVDHSVCSTSCNDTQDGCISKGNSVEFLATDSEAKLQKSKDSPHGSFSNTQGRDLTKTSVITPGAEFPVVPDVKGASTEANQENIESSSSVFGPSHRLLGNGLQRKVSLLHGDMSEPYSSVNIGLMKLQEPHCVEQKGQNRIVHQTSPEPNPKKQVKHGSSANSLSSSPPLEHMKISFHPINGFETSKLKLKFPDEHHFHDSIKDVMFPSFQLLPEPAIPSQDIGSESDDDTFCRSSPYMSDELMSQQSESNSEWWESGEIPGSKDHEIYGALRKVSSAESISSSLELEEIAHDSIYPDCDFRNPDTENGQKTFHSGCLLDLPNFDAVDPLTSEQGRKGDRDGKDILDLALQHPNEPTPPPPPLPPLQWRVMTQHFAVVEDKQGAISEAVNRPNDVQVLGSTTYEQPKPDPPKQPHIKETAECPLKSKQDQQKLNGRREGGPAVNGKDMDERGDLLQQIRAKSFNLRRTVPARPTLTPGPTTNIKVTAILEKANAIRQAFVGSDDERDDDNWSDG